MPIFNMIGGGGGGLIDAELVAETTGAYYSGSQIKATTPVLEDISADYAYAVDVQLNETPTGRGQLVRFFGLMGRLNNGSTGYYDALYDTYGVVVQNDNYDSKYIASYVEGHILKTGNTNTVLKFCSGNTNSYYATIQSGTTYTLKFYKIKLP